MHSASKGPVLSTSVGKSRFGFLYLLTSVQIQSFRAVCPKVDDRETIGTHASMWVVEIFKVLESSLECQEKCAGAVSTAEVESHSDFH